MRVVSKLPKREANKPARVVSKLPKREANKPARVVMMVKVVIKGASPICKLSPTLLFRVQPTLMCS